MCVNPEPYSCLSDGGVGLKVSRNIQVKPNCWHQSCLKLNQLVAKKNQLQTIVDIIIMYLFPLPNGYLDCTFAVITPS